MQAAFIIDILLLPGNILRVLFWFLAISEKSIAQESKNPTCAGHLVSLVE